jgi:hypothetical protein
MLADILTPLTLLNVHGSHIILVFPRIYPPLEVWKCPHEMC